MVEVGHVFLCLLCNRTRTCDPEADGVLSGDLKVRSGAPGFVCVYYKFIGSDGWRNLWLEQIPCELGLFPAASEQPSVALNYS